MDILKTIHDIGIVPVVAIDDAKQIVDLCKALEKGGLPAAEITFRTAAGREAIAIAAKECPNILVGAGTVITVEQCKAAIESGAKFIVSPGYFDDVVNYCVENSIPVLPGCTNASDCMKAVNAGLKIVKFFPAEACGGVSFIKNLAPVFGQLNFMPTGGVNTKNMMDYLGYDRIHACGGTWMVKKDLINDAKWDEIESICADAVKNMLGLKIKHVGINCENEEEASKIAKQFCTILGFDYKAGNSSIFAGTAIECNKTIGRGKNGHIGMACNDLDRTVYHLGRMGVEFDMENAKYDDNGKLKTVYFKDEFGGFAIHLMK
ncbi:MAG: bifunctional 4-hydroxy-2-oxoglutarate aldolase/2-dehydro-3-deoxy-phosphogluconate aldolase [Bacillota bacterium]|nr:bifunctional 4-hydroxy-2-oxoglutarate aldolase/2-dehydro-3-deoxy-phosphogluconate aldolase [Bacillota bacterium]